MRGRDRDRDDAAGKVDYAALFRLLARRCGIPPREAKTLTLSQALALLDDDPDDPHKGNLPISSLQDLRDVCGVG